MKKLFNLIALLFTASICTYGGNTIYVTSADDSGVGTLREAITTTSASGDSIVIDESITEIVLASGIGLSTSKNLSINGNGCVIRVTEPGVSVSRCLAFNFGSFRTVSLYNLTLRGGKIDTQSSDNAFGACLYVKRVYLRMYNCTLSDGVGKKGGALADCSTADQSSSMLIVNCNFRNNRATDTGGAINVTGLVDQNFIFTNCIFENNSNTGSGTTALFIPRPATITKCVFRNNISNKADPDASKVRNAALSLHFGAGTSVVENCFFENNESKASSTARHIGGSALTHYNSGNGATTGELKIINTTFANNKGCKAAVYLRDGNTTIVNCTFVGNKSGDPAYAGALCMKDSVTDNKLILVNNIFAYNYDQAKNNEDVYVAPDNEANVTGSNNLIAVTASNLSSLTNPVAFAYDGDNPANDSKLFASYTTNTDDKKVPVIDEETGTAALLNYYSVAIGAGTSSYPNVDIPTTDQTDATRAATPCIGAREGLGLPTSVNKINATGFKYWSSDGTLSIISAKTQNINLFGIDGRIIRTICLQEGLNIVPGLSKGIYLLEKQKIIIR